jgi:hypothetical protein
MSAPPPTPADQVAFLGNIERLLSEGQFVATYKYALLVAIANLAVQLGADDGSELELPIRSIAEQFIELYWRQCAPYGAPGADGPAAVIIQNNGQQAAIVSIVARTDILPHRRAVSRNPARTERQGARTREARAAGTRAPPGGGGRTAPGSRQPHRRARAPGRRLVSRATPAALSARPAPNHRRRPNPRRPRRGESRFPALGRAVRRPARSPRFPRTPTSSTIARIPESRSSKITDSLPWLRRATVLEAHAGGISRRR